MSINTTRSSLSNGDHVVRALGRQLQSRPVRLLFLAVFQVMLSGCAVFPYKANSNSAQNNPAVINKQASFNLRHEPILNAEKKIDCTPKKNNRVLVLLALSGGGSRAALFSGMSMLEMQKMKVGNDSNLLSEVDAISSVSGGSLPAAYYASSEDENETCSKAKSGRVWNESNVIDLMGDRNYINRWIGSWFLPTNIFLYWLTPYDRSDIMSQTLADNLFDVNSTGIDLRFSDLNPKRPNLIINATQGSLGRSFGQPFTFTQEDFDERICSSVDDYLLSRGVMASASFPGVFNFMTLNNYCKQNTDMKYVHLFDGGNSDNLGLTSLKRVIWNLHNTNQLGNYDKIVVILIDSATEHSGVNPNDPDPRSVLDHIIDTNIISATDSLLDKNRARLVNDFMIKRIFPFYLKSGPQDSVEAQQEEFSEACNNFFSWKDPESAKAECEKDYWRTLDRDVSRKLEFKHLQFRDVPDPDLRGQLNSIATNFKLDSVPDKSTGMTAKEAIICAVPLLYGQDNQCSYLDKEQKRQTITYHPKPATRDDWNKFVRDFPVQKIMQSSRQ